MRQSITTAQIQRNGLTIKGKYLGGPYIDVYLPGEESPSDCINVFDYEAGKSKIRHITGDIQKELSKWYDSQIEEN